MRALLWIYVFLPLLILLGTFSSANADIHVSPHEVIQYALKFGVQYQNIREEHLSASQDLLVELAKYDFQLEGTLNYEISQTESLSVFSNLEDRYLRYSLGLSKKLGAGIGIETGYNRTSQSSTLSAFQQSQGSLSKTNLDKLYLNLSIDLWKNSFGLADKQRLRTAHLAAQKNEMQFLEKTEEYILNIMKLYWEAYVAKEQLAQSLSSRTRLKKLVKSVRKKDTLGYSNPGELEQVTAELEESEQTVKLNSHNYLSSVALFAQKIKIKVEGEIYFKVDPLLPDLPSFPQTRSENLRSLRIAKADSDSALQIYKAVSSEAKPSLKLDINSTVTGGDQSSSKSLSEMFSGTRPVYYAGFTLSTPLGTKASDAAVQKARSLSAINKNKYSDLLEEIEVNKKSAQNKVVAHYEVAKSAIRTVEHRKKMIRKMERAYSQGRSDIDALINAYNSFFFSETKKIRAIGDYHISLNELAAINDQLVTPKDAK